MAVGEEYERIRKIRQGDQAELERFLSGKKPLVNLAIRPYFLKGGDESDLAEEALIGLVASIASFDPQKNDSFDAYALTVMRRRIVNAVKSMNRLKHGALNESETLSIKVGDEGRELERAAVSEDPIDRYVSEERSRRFYEAAQKALTPEEYEILKRYLEGYTYREIAEKSESSVKDVDNAIYRIKKKIKRQKGLFYDET